MLATHFLHNEKGSVCGRPWVLFRTNETKKVDCLTCRLTLIFKEAQKKEKAHNTRVDRPAQEKQE